MGSTNPGEFTTRDGWNADRYIVAKTSGETDPNAVYFVLRIDKDGSDPSHIRACRDALKTYCRTIAKDKTAPHLQALVQDLADYLDASDADQFKDGSR